MKNKHSAHYLFAQIVFAYAGNSNVNPTSEDIHKAESTIEKAKANPDRDIGASILYVNARAYMSKGNELERRYTESAIECIEKLPDAAQKLLVIVRTTDADCMLKDASYKSLFDKMQGMLDNEELLKMALQAAVYADPGSSWETLATNRCQTLLNNISDLEIRKETMNNALKYVKTKRKKAGYIRAGDNRGLLIQKELAQTIYDMDHQEVTATPVHPKHHPKKSAPAADIGG